MEEGGKGYRCGALSHFQNRQSAAVLTHLGYHGNGVAPPSGHFKLPATVAWLAGIPLWRHFVAAEQWLEEVKAGPHSLDAGRG